eukprot:scaffold7382_cov406-Prasinococcus_capsulatus_cf.AAC.26
MCSALAPILAPNKGCIVTISSFLHYTVSVTGFERAINYWTQSYDCGWDSEVAYPGGTQEYACTKLAAAMITLHLSKVWGHRGLNAWYVCLPSRQRRSHGVAIGMLVMSESGLATLAYSIFDPGAFNSKLTRDWPWLYRYLFTQVLPCVGIVRDREAVSRGILDIVDAPKAPMINGAYFFRGVGMPIRPSPIATVAAGQERLWTLCGLWAQRRTA